MKKLSPSFKNRFMSRFQGGHDSMLRRISYTYGSGEIDSQCELIISIQETVKGWINLRLVVTDVKKFLFREGPSNYQVIYGFSFDWFENRFYLSLDLDSYPDIAYTQDDYESSQFYVVGDNCFWEMLPYDEQPTDERYLEIDAVDIEDDDIAEGQETSYEDYPSSEMQKAALEEYISLSRKTSYVGTSVKKGFKKGMKVKFGELEDGDKFRDETGTILSKFPMSVLPVNVATNAINLSDPERQYFFTHDTEVEFVESASDPFPYHVFDTIR